MHIPVTTYYLPLFFLSAWIASNRDLSGRLRYQVPVSLRFNCPAIWQFWVWDLLLSAIAIPIVIVNSHVTTRFAFSGADQMRFQQALSNVVYALWFLGIGLAWPKLTNLKISVGGSRARNATLNLAAIRNQLLKSAIDRINKSLHSSVEGYVERVIRGIRRRPENFEQFLRNLNIAWHDNSLAEAKIARLRKELLRRAESNLETLYKEASEVEMIPLYDRSKSLMAVPAMTMEEEEVLYRHGIRSVPRLALIRHASVGDIGAERVAELQANARHLIGSHVRSRIMLVLVFVALTVLTTGLEGVSSRYLRQQTPEAQDLGPSHP